MRAEVGEFSVLNSDVPGFVAPGEFEPYNRADRVLGVTVPGLTFDDPAKPLYVLSATGDLVPADVDWVAEASPSDLVVRNAPDDADLTSDGLCFTSTDSVQVIWPLGDPVPGPGLVVRTEASVGSTTPVQLSVRPGGETRFDRANKDRHTLSEERSGVLDAVAAPSVATVRLKGFEPGVPVCVQSIALGQVQPRG